ncbi:MAG: type II secretion system protein GspL [Candidatus Competibacteraceae bacterium]|nr:type II secretion system protein GspL [Candidatus Competibacteraceae bacterium]MBK8896286.1 type II secretion system protein GspL [Candidatus Competibacteraceae bacterium]MBK9950185.1 type II secretion system protein GspL [Candidatus Competibacteraceae bacterium]
MPAQSFFFRLLSSEQAEWRRPDGGIRRGALSELAAEAAGARQILVAPGEAIMLNPVIVPSRKRTTWARAIPYALEDQLVEDIEALHFVLGNTPEGDRLPVAIVNHSALRAWLDVCHLNGIAPAAAIPDILLVPWQEGDWSVLLEDRRAVVRVGRWEGFATERDTLGLLLDRTLIEADANRPRRLRIWGRNAAQFSEPALADLERHIETEPVEALPLFASALQSGAALNLLQGPYGRQNHWGRWLRPWRAAAALAGLCLLVQGVTTVYQHWRLRQESVALGTEMERVYKDAIPESTRIVNPKVQMEAHLRELRPNTATAGTFLELLNRGAQPVANFQDVILRGFSYRDGQLDLSLQGGNPAALDQLRQQLNQQPGLQAEMRTTQREGQIESKVILKKAAS